MRRALASIDIAAPIEVVWQVMTDLDQYGAWNPFVVRVESIGALAVGARFRVHVRWADGGKTDAGEIVTRLDAPAGAPGHRQARFAYRFEDALAKLHFVVAEREQVIEEVGGMTRYSTSEAFGGLLQLGVPLRRVQDGFERQAAALKARAESLARS